MTFGDLLKETNLTENQLLFWLGSALTPGVELDTEAVVFSFEIEGALNPGRFDKAFRKLVSQSDSLRSVFHEVDKIPQRKVNQAVDSGLEFVSFTDSPDAKAAYSKWFENRRKRPLNRSVQVFDLSEGINESQAMNFQHARANRIEVVLRCGRAVDGITDSDADELGKRLIVVEAQRVGDVQLRRLLVHEQGIVKAAERLR